MNIFTVRPQSAFHPAYSAHLPKLFSFAGSLLKKPREGGIAISYNLAGVSNRWRTRGSWVNFAGAVCLKDRVIDQLLNTIVPKGAIAVEVFSPTKASGLFPEESQLLGNVCEKRRLEFSIGRSCAHAALASLGTEPQPILRGTGREPIWPAGIVGSITHCEGYCAAAVARKADVAGFGIDAEAIRPVSEDVLRLIATVQELGCIDRLERSAHRWIPWKLLLFSAKESVFKTWFPIARTWLGFEQVRVEFSETGSGFKAFISGTPTGVPRELGRIEGRFIAGDTHVMTCAYACMN